MLRYHRNTLEQPISNRVKLRLSPSNKRYYPPLEPVPIYYTSDSFALTVAGSTAPAIEFRPEGGSCSIRPSQWMIGL